MSAAVPPNHFSQFVKEQCHGVANEVSVIKENKIRITVLSHTCLRIEYSNSCKFEDRPTTVVINRQTNFQDYKANVDKEAKCIDVHTQNLHLHYKWHGEDQQPFTAENFFIELINSNNNVNDNKNSNNIIWKFAMPEATNVSMPIVPDPLNLGGTARTLDRTSGAVALQEGLLSRSGYTILNDTCSLIFGDNGWIVPRNENNEKSTTAETTPTTETTALVTTTATAPTNNNNEYIDFYFFGYGSDYLQCLREFTKLSGPIPLIPRYSLGNWWSKYWEYNEESIKNLVLLFKQHQIPLSVVCIDMDWHLVEDLPTSPGWTGYTWNKQLFPDPRALLQWMKKEGVRVNLNLHPASGCHVHEDAYKAFCEYMGMNSEEGKPILFECTDEKFMTGYFHFLHHPHEDMGVDFWWIDWQHGNKSKIAGLDPMWWLNHLHYQDISRDPNKRPLIMSRWGGLGNHRYQIGFSGDTDVSWISLQLQPYFTSTAANVCFDYWSHDIGGFWHGFGDGELYARWVQFGVFSPLLRLHSMKDEFEERRPWKFNSDTFEASKHAFQLRCSLVPFIYSFTYKTYTQSIPLVMPLYYRYPHLPAAYVCSNQYLFGESLIVCPFIKPSDPLTRLSRTLLWLPEGDWFHLFTGQRQVVNGWNSIYGKLNEIPVYAKAGSIVPMLPINFNQQENVNNIDDWQQIELHIFPNGEGEFVLYEDDGISQYYDIKKAFATTRISQTWCQSETKTEATKNENNNNAQGDVLFTQSVTIEKAQGDLSVTPSQRTYTLLFKGIMSPPVNVAVAIDNNQQETTTFQYDKHKKMVSVVVNMLPSNSASITLTHRVASQALVCSIDKDVQFHRTKQAINQFKVVSDLKRFIMDAYPRACIEGLNEVFAPLEEHSVSKALLELIAMCGWDCYVVNKQTTHVVIWNHNNSQELLYKVTLKGSACSTGPASSMNEFAVVPKEGIVWLFDSEWCRKNHCTVTLQYGKFISDVIEVGYKETKKQSSESGKKGFWSFLKKKK